jgi:hypothetical protein
VATEFIQLLVKIQVDTEELLMLILMVHPKLFDATNKECATIMKVSIHQCTDVRALSNCVFRS